MRVGLVQCMACGAFVTVEGVAVAPTGFVCDRCERAAVARDAYRQRLDAPRQDWVDVLLIGIAILVLTVAVVVGLGG